jgi:hypothetical protein
VGWSGERLAFGVPSLDAARAGPSSRSAAAAGAPHHGIGGVARKSRLAVRRGRNKRRIVSSAGSPMQGDVMRVRTCVPTRKPLAARTEPGRSHRRRRSRYRRRERLPACAGGTGVRPTTPPARHDRGVHTHADGSLSPLPGSPFAAGGAGTGPVSNPGRDPALPQAALPRLVSSCWIRSLAEPVGVLSPRAAPARAGGASRGRRSGRSPGCGARRW